MNKKNTFYDILGVNKDAKTAEIRTQYHKLAKLYHPDRPNGNSKKFAMINEAYKILSNENSRDLYNYRLSSNKKIPNDIDDNQFFDENTLDIRIIYHQHLLILGEMGVITLPSVVIKILALLGIKQADLNQQKTPYLRYLMMMLLGLYVGNKVYTLLFKQQPKPISLPPSYDVKRFVSRLMALSLSIALIYKNRQILHLINIPNTIVDRAIHIVIQQLPMIFITLTMSSIIVPWILYPFLYFKPIEYMFIDVPLSLWHFIYQYKDIYLPFITSTSSMLLILYNIKTSTTGLTLLTFPTSTLIISALVYHFIGWYEAKLLSGIFTTGTIRPQEAIAGLALQKKEEKEEEKEEEEEEEGGGSKKKKKKEQRSGSGKSDSQQSKISQLIEENQRLKKEILKI